MATTANAVTSMQGVSTPAGVIDPAAFMALTRRKRANEVSRPFAGLGQPDNLQIMKTDVLSRVRLRFSGTLTVALGAGTASTTAAWPYGLYKNIKGTANGQTNIIDASGPSLKAREYIVDPELNDRGIVRTVNNVSVQNGTLSKVSENWGVGQNSTLATGTYPVEIDVIVPFAEDDKDLSGAIFCQTSQMDISCAVQWALQSDLFNVAGGATVALAGVVTMETEKFNIPSLSGSIVLPDLSVFHSIVETNYTSVANALNDVHIIGQGAGKSLLRVFYRTLNGGGSAAAPLAVTAANYGQQTWRYGTSDQPETYLDGAGMRHQNEKDVGSDIAGVWGFMLHDFALLNAFRDSVDMGQTSELRINVGIQNGVALVSPQLLYTQEIIFGAGA